MEEKIDTKKQLKISLPIAFENLVNVFMTLVDTLAISTIRNKRTWGNRCNGSCHKHNANEYSNNKCYKQFTNCKSNWRKR